MSLRYRAVVYLKALGGTTKVLSDWTPFRKQAIAWAKEKVAELGELARSEIESKPTSAEREGG